MDVIRDAFARRLIYPDYVGLEEIEIDNRRQEETLLAELRRKVDYWIPQDIHGYLSRFACFRENSVAPHPKPGFDYNVVRKKQKAAKKTRNKMAKKSRKKNRKK